MNGCARVFCLAAVLATSRMMAADATMTSSARGAGRGSGHRPQLGVLEECAARHGRAGHTAASPLPQFATEVRSRWTAGNLYFLFICPYDELYLKPNPTTLSETNELWKWDVAEVFLGSDFKNIKKYKEFEISPQGEWIDLDIDLNKPHHEDGWVWNSAFQVAARIDRAKKIWYGTMRIPFAALATVVPAPGLEFRMNLFRGQGPPSNWKSITWQPPMTGTFHTPERFGVLKLADAAR